MLFCKNSNPFLVEARRVEVPQRGTSCTDVPTRSRRSAAEPLGDDTEFNSPDNSLPNTKAPPKARLLYLVEARRVELLSENASKGTSPGADACFGIAPGSPPHRSTVKPVSRVASLCMVRSKLCALTSASDRRPASGPRHSRRGRVTA